MCHGIGARAAPGWSDPGGPVAEAMPLFQIATEGELEQVESHGVGVVRYRSRGVIQGGDTQIDAFVIKDSHVVNVYVVNRRIAVRRMMETGIRKPRGDVLPGKRLVTFVSLAPGSQIMRVDEVAAGCLCERGGDQGDWSTSRARRRRRAHVAARRH